MRIFYKSSIVILGSVAVYLLCALSGYFVLINDWFPSANETHAYLGIESFLAGAFFICLGCFSLFIIITFVEVVVNWILT